MFNQLKVEFQNHISKLNEYYTAEIAQYKNSLLEKDAEIIVLHEIIDKLKFDLKESSQSPKRSIELSSELYNITKKNAFKLELNLSNVEHLEQLKNYTFMKFQNLNRISIKSIESDQKNF